MNETRTTRQNRIREALGRIYENEPPYFRDYLRRFREDPTSRVFAPLAEAYRRLGRLDEAIELCREGLENHPDFHGGRVALAKCLMDKRDWDGAKAELERVVQKVPENLLAQRLLGESYLASGDNPRALHCFKMALLLSPNDVSLAEKVRAMERGELLETTNTFSGEETVEASAPQESDLEVMEPAWKETQPIEDAPVSDEEERSLNAAKVDALLGVGGDSDEDAFTVTSIDSILEGESSLANSEITTETLGDLYLSQGQFDRALRIFEKVGGKGETPELRKKIHLCRASLGVDRRVMIRNRQIEVLSSILRVLHSST